jgi:hypothetical protein
VFRGLVGIFLVILGVLVPSGSIFAAAGPWWSTDHGAVRLIAESNAVGSACRFSASTQLEGVTESRRY